MEDGKKEQENKHNQADSRYLVLWVCVIVCASVILVGWLFSMKYSFNKINEESAKKINITSQQAQQQVLDMFDGANAILNQGGEQLQQLKKDQAAKDAVPVVPVVPVVPAQLP